jgi:thiol-disulfide isomerase/thioredoxin
VCGCSVWTARLLVLLVLVSGTGAAAPAAPAASPSLELEARKVESALLHHQIDFAGVRVWDARSKKWLSRGPAPGRILVVNVWAVECPPCVAEFPVLRDLMRSFRSDPVVRFAFVSETKDETKLLGFARTNRDKMPEAELYQVTDERLRNSLETTKQPITLLLDQNMVVRQAFVGSIAGRRLEFVESLERLSKRINAQSVTAKP